MTDDHSRVEPQRIPRYLTVDHVEKLIQLAEQAQKQPQNFRKGKSMVGAGFVSDFQIIVRG